MTSTDPRRALPPEPRRRRPLLIGLLVGFLVLTGSGIVAVVTLGGPWTAPPGPSPSATPTAACASATSVAVDPAYVDTAAALFAAYAAAQGQACIPLTATKLASSDAAAHGVGDAKAWIPEDAVWQRRSAALATAKAVPIGWTPLVVVAPKELSDAVGAPLVGDTLVDLVTLKKTFADYGKPDWGRFKLVLPDPATSSVGASGFVSLALQVSRGELPPAAGQPPTANQVAMAQAQYRIVEQPATAAGVLDALASNPADANALTKASPRVGITTEAATLGHPQMVAAYLDAAATTAHVALVEVASDAAVEGFAAWLGTDAGRAAVASRGLRSGDQTPSEIARSEVGLPTTALTEGSALSVEKVGLGQQLAQALGTRMTIAMALDVSGSMGTKLPGTQTRRIDLVSQASTFDWDSWPPGSEASFMTFNTDDAYRSQIRTVVPFIKNTDPAWQQAKPQMQAALQGIQVGRGTPLFSAIRDGYRYVAGHQTTNQRRLIVITDGKQEYANDSITERQLLDDLPDDVKAAGVQLVLVALGPDADFTTLQRIAQGTGGTAVQVYDVAQYPAVAARIMAP